ncbi:type II CAAX endopeptidase family protein [Brevundimonas sp.]|uniref:CPBP family intramembrane glutamic endopeptidase n=1 Tax=Brevundimonas sp. TaxID=1871086 RepID=UPI002E0FF3CB|nr:type II CAAX endopeptidase family protein [Brevundimonas sp.]
MFMVLMWSPTVIALGFIAFNRAARSGLLWKLGRVRYLPVAVVVPTLLAFAMLAILIGVGAATSGWFAFTTSGVVISEGPWVLGEGFQIWPLFAANVAATAVVFSVVTLGVTVGEEFAWRGFLQGHLTRRAGVIRGILILSFIWSIWHLPALLAGYNFPNYPVLGAFVLFPLQTLGLSFFFGWLTIRSGSFWPAALGHAALNSIQQGVIDNLQLSVGIIYVDILRTVLGLIVGLMCWASLRRDPD